MDPKEVIAGLDKETLDAIAQFGGEYMDYLWWKEIILPTVGNVFVSCVAVSVIVFVAWCFVQSGKTPDEPENRCGYTPTSGRRTPPPAPPRTN